MEKTMTELAQKIQAHADKMGLPAGTIEANLADPFEIANNFAGDHYRKSMQQLTEMLQSEMEIDASDEETARAIVDLVAESGSKRAPGRAQQAFAEMYEGAEPEPPVL